MLEGGEGQVEEEICLENQGYTGLAASPESYESPAKASTATQGTCHHHHG